MTNFGGIVAVHAGAGYHDKSERKGVLDLCKLACEKGQQDLIVNGKNAVDACVTSTMILENSPLTNAGVGSNLTSSKLVECDAGLMDGKNLTFAGVGALSNVRNPILLPYEMLKKRNNTSKLLVQPLLICGQGALEFAKSSQKIQIVDDDELFTPNSLQNYERCAKILRKQEEKNFVQQLNGKLDTVGCVTVDAEGFVAASCSSGGILMKQPGRIGQAALYGCGCWAQNTPGKSIAVSVSGCGEYLIQTRFAQLCAETILENNDDGDELSSVEIIEKFFNKKFLCSNYLQNVDSKHKIAGAIIVIVDRANVDEEEDKKLSLEFIFVHNSPTMCLSHTKKSGQISGIISKSKHGKIIVSGRSVS